MPIGGPLSMQQEPVRPASLPGIVEIALTACPFITESAGLNSRPFVEQPYPLAVGDRGRIIGFEWTPYRKEDMPLRRRVDLHPEVALRKAAGHKIGSLHVLPRGHRDLIVKPAGVKTLR